MFNKSIDTTTTTTLSHGLASSTLHSTYIHVYVYTYVLHSRPTDFHSSTRLNSGSHSAELVQSTKTTTDPSRIFLVARHTTSPHLTTITSPLPSPHHHCHSHAFSGCSVPCLFISFGESLTEPLLHKPPRGSSISLSISLSLPGTLSGALSTLLRSYTSGAEISMYYLPVTRSRTVK